MCLKALHVLLLIFAPNVLLIYVFQYNVANGVSMVIV
jgi:hypothetical protein